jgi:hypothetical protein
MKTLLFLLCLTIFPWASDISETRINVSKCSEKVPLRWVKIDGHEYILKSGDVRYQLVYGEDGYWHLLIDDDLDILFLKLENAKLAGKLIMEG